LKKPTRARAVAFPVISHAQMVRAKLVIPVPRRETNWPAQTRVKAAIPTGLLPLIDTASALFESISWPHRI